MALSIYFFHLKSVVSAAFVKNKHANLSKRAAQVGQRHARIASTRAGAQIPQRFGAASICSRGAEMGRPGVPLAAAQACVTEEAAESQPTPRALTVSRSSVFFPARNV